MYRPFPDPCGTPTRSSVRAFCAAPAVATHTACTTPRARGTMHCSCIAGHTAVREVSALMREVEQLDDVRELEDGATPAPVLGEGTLLDDFVAEASRGEPHAAPQRAPQEDARSLGSLPEDPEEWDFESAVGSEGSGGVAESYRHAPLQAGEARCTCSCSRVCALRPGLQRRVALTMAWLVQGGHRRAAKCRPRIHRRLVLAARARRPQLRADCAGRAARAADGRGVRRRRDREPRGRRRGDTRARLHARRHAPAARH